MGRTLMMALPHRATLYGATYFWHALSLTSRSPTELQPSLGWQLYDV